MSDQGILSDVRQTDIRELERLQRRFTAGEQARTARDELIRHLREQGETLDTITAATGLTPMRVSQIARGTR